MLDYDITGPFKKDRKLMQKRNRDIKKLREVMALLIKEQPLSPKHENHPLHGKDKGKWECHVEPNWVLVYRIDDENRKVVFYRTGSHADLF